MTQTEALRMALEALQKIYIAPEHEEYIRVWWPACEQAITAIREALAQPEQEPVCDKDPQGCWSVRCQLGNKCKNTPPKREWQGLTDEAVWSLYKNLWMFHPAEEPRLAGDILKFARAIEAKLKEKNT